MIADLMAFAQSGDFQAWKVLIEDYTGLAKDALHVHIGLAIFVAVRLIWRWRFGWLVAWLAALVAALGGEWLDLRGEMSRSDIQPGNAHWHDIWNTMLWPTILLFIGRWLQPKNSPKLKAEAEEDQKDETPDTESSDLADKPFEKPSAV